MCETAKHRPWAGLVLVLAVLALTTSCGRAPLYAEPAPASPPSTPASSTAAAEASAPARPTAPAYSTPPTPVERVARRFATQLVAYDSRRERALDFLAKLRPVTTRAALESLADSPRAHLPWSAMRARQERVALAITGTSSRGRAEQRLTLVVTGIAATRTDVATLRHPVELRLRMVRGQGGWRVSGLGGRSA